MTPKLTSLQLKRFKKRAEEQDALGYPDFKAQIAKDIVEMYDVQHEEAMHFAFHPDISKLIMSDIGWAQHMGTEYWAEVIFDKYHLKKRIS